MTALILALSLLPLCSASGDTRIVLTIGDMHDRSSARMDGENQLGLWRYLEDQPGVEIRFVHLTPEVYAAGLSSGDLPDIVATDNNLATILDNGVAFNAGPYMEQYVPNFMQGETRMAYDVFTALLDEGDGFSFFRKRSAITVSDTAMDRQTAAMSSAGTIIRSWVIRRSAARMTI